MIEIGKACDPGIKRKGKPNQDTIGVVLPGLVNKKPPLLIVADGMGGFQEGQKASQITVDELSKAYKNPIQKSDYTAILKKGVAQAHKKINQYVANHQNIVHIGTTIAAVVVDDHKLHLVNVGDSRIYLINEKEIKQISYDHSLVAEQVRHGIIKPEEADKHPHRNVLMLSISSKHEKIDPYASSLDYKAGDYVLICSDGLWGTVSESQIHDVVIELAPQKAADKLVQMANMNQGPDNISVIIAKLA